MHNCDRENDHVLSKSILSITVVRMCEQLQKYRKILIISPVAYFWSKDLFKNFFLGGGLIFGGTYTWTNICILKMLFFVQATVIF